MDIKRFVEESTAAGKNKAQLTVSTTGSTRYVHWYNWSEFLSNYFKAIPNITKYHHFRVKKANPGKVYVREYANSAKEEVNTYKKNVSTASLRGKKPLVITPTGQEAMVLT